MIVNPLVDLPIVMKRLSIELTMPAAGSQMSKDTRSFDKVE